MQDELSFEVTITPSESARLHSYLLRFWSPEGLLAGRRRIDQLLRFFNKDPTTSPGVPVEIGPNTLDFLWAFTLAANGLPMTVTDEDGEIEDDVAAANGVRISFRFPDDPDMPPLGEEAEDEGDF